MQTDRSGSCLQDIWTNSARKCSYELFKYMHNKHSGCVHGDIVRRIKSLQYLIVFTRTIDSLTRQLWVKSIAEWVGNWHTSNKFINSWNWSVNNVDYSRQIKCTQTVWVLCVRFLAFIVQCTIDNVGLVHGSVTAGYLHNNYFSNKKRVILNLTNGQREPRKDNYRTQCFVPVNLRLPAHRSLSIFWNYMM